MGDYVTVGAEAPAVARLVEGVFGVLDRLPEQCITEKVGLKALSVIQKGLRVQSVSISENVFGAPLAEFPTRGLSASESLAEAISRVPDPGEGTACEAEAQAKHAEMVEAVKREAVDKFDAHNALLKREQAKNV